MGTQLVPLVTPVKGVVRAVGRESQPPDTCWDAKNVLPYDRWGRLRVAQRGGLKREFPDPLAASFIQGMMEAPNIIYPPNDFNFTFGNLSDELTGWPDPPDFNNGDYGPYPYNGPSFGLSLSWSMVVTATLTVNVDNADPDWAANTCGGSCKYAIQIGDLSTDYLIVIVGGDATLAGGSFAPGGINPSVTVGFGNPASPTIVANLSFSATPTSGTSESTSTTVTVTVANGRWTVTATGAAAPYDAALPVSQTNFPEPTVYRVHIENPPGGINVNDVSVNLNVTG